MNLLNCVWVSLGLALLAESGFAEGSHQPAAKAPAHIQLDDQYNVLQRLSFPGTNITVLAIADRKGSEQVDGWIAMLKHHYAGRIDLRGLADVGGVPGFLQAKIRKRFQEARRYPVMMDWSGKVCRQFGYQPGLANMLIVDYDGRILGRFCGDAIEPNLKSFCTVLDKALLPKSTP